MLAYEIFNTCSNEHIAHAAVVCIGGDFAQRAAEAANAEGMTLGVYIAQIISDYQNSVGPSALLQLELLVQGHETPVLAGLKYIVEAAHDQWPHDARTEWSKKDRDFLHLFDKNPSGKGWGERGSHPTAYAFLH